MKKFVVLITTSGSVTAQCVIKALRNQTEYDVRIVTVDITDVTAGKYLGDAFYVLPNELDEEGYRDRLKEIIKEERVDIVVPIHDNELAVTAKYKGEIEKETQARVFVSEFNVIQRCNDKGLTQKFFEELGIQTPRVFSSDELVDTENLPYPLFMKPRNGVAAIDTHRIEDSEDLKFYLRKVQDPIVAECVEGKEYSIDAYTNMQGEMVNAIPRQRVVISGGASTAGQVVKRLDMIETVKKMCEKLPILGPANIQCFERDAKEGPLYFEVNPRFSAAHIFSIKSGMNSPLYMLREFDGKKVEPNIGEMEEIRAFRYWQEVFVDKEGKRLKNYPL
ncbi:MAG: ATP-grasp domain-containing protein [bacterium]|nr:ATP-grasp domain-containing protein [bacterium]